jgi:hypothetical protein
MYSKVQNAHTLIQEYHQNIWLWIQNINRSSDVQICLRFNNYIGRAMAQAVIRRPFTAEARVRSQVDPCGICGGQSGTGTGLSPSTSVLKWKSRKILIFITGLQNKP